MSDGPSVSVVVPSVNGLPYPVDCVNALLGQHGASPEVIVVDCSGDATVDVIRSTFPTVRVIALDEPASVPTLRTRGLAAASACYVAITEDHCVPRPDWCARLLAGQARTGWAVVGGPVENGSTGRAVDWAAFLSDYSAFLCPVAEGATGVVPGMNVLYDTGDPAVRDAVLRGEWGESVHERLRTSGASMGMIADAVVDHTMRFTALTFVTGRFHFARTLAAARSHRWSVGTRAVRLLACTVLPAVFVGRIAGDLMRRRRHRLAFLRALPLIVVGAAAAAAGEACGYVIGPGGSPLKVR